MDVPEDNIERKLDALFRVNRFMAAVGDLRELLTRIMEESKEVADAEASALMLHDAEANELYFEVALGDKADAVREIRLAVGEGLAGACAESREPVVVNDCETDPRHSKRADETSSFTTRNLLAVPILRGDNLLGVLEVLNKRHVLPFTDDDLRMMQFFADQAAIAIERALLVQQNMQNERLAAVGQTVLSISHYAKNILTGMKGSASLVEMGLKNDNLGTVRDAWEIQKRSQTKISRLVHDMLTYSKEREPHREELNLEKFVGEIVESQRLVAENSGVKLSFVAGGVGNVAADEDMLHDAILNLIVNAIDALRDFGGGDVTVTTRFNEDPEHVEIVVEDNGPGIPREIQKKIFEPFFSTKGAKGTGLGLAVTKKVAEEHGGRLTLFTEDGKGTCFVIRLPR